jgi:hypothetical protein
LGCVCKNTKKLFGTGKREKDRCLEVEARDESDALKGKVARLLYSAQTKASIQEPGQ